jgi:hypothetical protein
LPRWCLGPTIQRVVLVIAMFVDANEQGISGA